MRVHVVKKEASCLPALSSAGRCPSSGDAATRTSSLHRVLRILHGAVNDGPHPRDSIKQYVWNYLFHICYVQWHIN